jgi:hypothetical protein
MVMVPQQSRDQWRSQQAHHNGDGRPTGINDVRRCQPLMPIGEALRIYCGIDARLFFLAAYTGDGEPKTYLSPGQTGQRLHEDTVGQFFEASKFQQVAQRVESGADPLILIATQPPTAARRDSRVSDASGPGVPTARKRRRTRTRHRLNEDDQTSLVISSRKALRIGDEQAVWKFYETRFKNCHQNLCKILAKAWVKVVEPRKQTNHPYTGGDDKAPTWWPQPWGTSKEEKVRHKEPDHLHKPERVHMLCHILRLVIPPHAQQHADIQKVSLDVARLEGIAYDCLASFFDENESNASKRPYLNELFKVARQEERYRHGDIDGSAEVFVMADDRAPPPSESDNEDDSTVKREGGIETPRGNSTALSTDTTPEPRAAASIQASAYMNDLPLRQQYAHPIVPDLSGQGHHFVEGTGLTAQSQQPVNHGAGGMPMDLVQSPQDASRRPSIFSDYASPGTSMYPQQWQPSSSTGNYAYSATQPSNAHPPFVNHGMPLNQGPTFMSPGFEGSSRAGYDGAGGSMFRANELSHAPSAHSEGYSYLPNDSHPPRNHMS